MNAKYKIVEYQIMAEFHQGDKNGEPYAINKVLFKKLQWPALLEEGAICVSLQVCVSRDTFREVTSRRFALHCVAKVRAICVMVGVLIDEELSRILHL